MKFYTFCTIILLVQLSKSEINKSLRHYDVIKKEQFIHNIVKRGASDSDHKFNKIREIDFHAHCAVYRAQPSVHSTFPSLVN